jgi:hypothetical protein
MAGRETNYSSYSSILLKNIFGLNKLQLFHDFFILALQIYRTVGRGVPGHLLGSCGSAAACIRIRGLLHIWRNNDYSTPQISIIVFFFPSILISFLFFVFSDIHRLNLLDPRSWLEKEQITHPTH